MLDNDYGNVGHLWKSRSQQFLKSAACGTPEHRRMTSECDYDADRIGGHRDRAKLIHCGQWSASFRVGHGGECEGNRLLIGRALCHFYFLPRGGV